MLPPDSHNDPGYKKTMDEYFYGLRNDIQNFSVSKILINVVHQLTLNHNRKYKLIMPPRYSIETKLNVLCQM